MALTVGSGPFGANPAGVFNFTPHGPERTLYFEDSPRRVRVVVAGATVADSDRAKLLHETGLLPVYYLPWADVRADALAPGDRSTHCPLKGDAAYWHLRVDGQVRENAAWSYPEPLAGAPDLSGHLAFHWDAVDEWWEESERVGVHPRDPYHRCDVLRSDRRVVARLDGAVVAESDHPTLLFETGLPPRFYLPEADVRMDLLEPSDTRTQCPYKGTTSRYYTLAVGSHRIVDAAWAYDHPHSEVHGIEGLLAFYDERLDLEVDGRPWRPDTRP